VLVREIRGAPGLRWSETAWSLDSRASRGGAGGPAAVGEVRTPPSRCGQSRWVAAAVAGGRGEGLRDGETESFSLSSVAAGGWWPIVSKLQPMVTNRYKLLWAWKPNQTNPFAVSAY